MIEGIAYDFKKTITSLYSVVSIFAIVFIIVGIGFAITSTANVPFTKEDPVRAAFLGFVQLLNPFISVIATLSAYYYYGESKVTGVLESIIAKPVTKGGLILSRFFGNLAVTSIGFVIGIVAFNIILFQEIGRALPAYYSVILGLAILVELSGFSGLIFLFSQFIKSPGAMNALVFAVMLGLGFFWPVLVSSFFSGVQLIYAASPGGYLTLLYYYFSGSSFPVLQVSAILVSLIGIGWLVTPAALAYFIGKYLD